MPSSTDREERWRNKIMNKGFETEDSGARKEFDSGMQRDVTDDKVDYSLVLDGPMFERWAHLMDRGAKKYEKRNWMKADSIEERERFRESALRHFLQWYWGEDEEDHAAAVIFNLNGAEYVNGKEHANEVLQLDQAEFLGCQCRACTGLNPDRPDTP